MKICVVGEGYGIGVCVMLLWLLCCSVAAPTLALSPFLFSPPQKNTEAGRFVTQDVKWFSQRLDHFNPLVCMYVFLCVRMCMPSLPSFFVLFLCCGVFAAFYDSEWCGWLAYGDKLQWFILRLLLLGGFVVCSSHTPFHLQLMFVCYHHHNKEESFQRIRWWWLLAGVIRIRIEKSWKSVKRFWC